MNVTKTGELVPVRLVSDRVRDGDGFVTITLCEDIRERIRIREALEGRDRILEAVAFAAARLLSTSDWQESVEEVLGRLGRATAADRVDLVLFGAGEAADEARQSFRWLAPHIDLPAALRAFTAAPAPQPGSPAFQLFDRFAEPLRRGDVLHADSPQLRDADRQDIRHLGLAGFAVVPVAVDGAWSGYLAVSNAQHPRPWSPTELEALAIAARTVGASIERQRAERALVRSEHRFRDLLENAHDLIQSVGADGRFRFVNRAWKEALRYGDDDLPNLVLSAVLRAPTDGETAAEAVLRADGPSRLEAMFVSRDGRQIAVEGTITRRVVDGQLIAAQGIFRDVTERRAIDRMKQEFLSTVSHELRTPLTSILASLALLASGRLDARPDRAEEMIRLAHRNGERLLRLINNLLDLQKLAARKMSLRTEAIEIDPLLIEAGRSLRPTADTREISLDVVGGPTDLWCLADRDRLMQVLQNLLSNAIKFSPPGARVDLSATAAGDQVRLAVADQGPGIPDEFRERLFEQFTQAEPSETRAAQGSGLGLSIVHGLVDAMGGTVHLETEVGRGSTFMVELPRAASVLPAVQSSRNGGEMAQAEDPSSAS
ncbi:MAG: ATP-binding protein, partial [Acidobacteriota bacterium]